ncbi:AraC family transcriptional regulator [Marinobacter sp. V034]|uniref:AraC family transcriptional regulator n=1 Tax=Marinobacter sp. V034 TaxID=3459610 RepID=UPI004044FED6
MRLSALFLRALLISVLSAPAMSDSLNSDIAELKGEVAALNHSLFELEEDILHPANTQVAVYLSFAAREYFVLDSVELSIDGHPAVSHLYTERERQALKQGGVQQLYLGNLSAGEHKIDAVFNGQGANDHYYRKDASFNVQKTGEKAQYELILDAKAPAFEPAFRIKEWE